MHLSWNEIRARAGRFAEEWKDAHYEKGETQTFYNEFFEIFGVTRRRVAAYEAPVRMLGDRRGFMDLFWKGVLLVEQKSAGRNLLRAKEQALEYFPGLKDHELPRYVLVSDFQNFELHDLDEGGEPVEFKLSDLHRHIEAFAFILGVQKRVFRDQDPVNIQASELMGELHDALKASGYKGHRLERFLVRILFCLFADDTGIFEPRDIFYDLIKDRTQEDGSDLGGWLTHLFEVLNQELTDRVNTLDDDLMRFPYVNGDLFAEPLSIPSFDAAMRKLLLDACEFSWDAISPAIFGSLFQSVMDDVERRQEGAHYTTERNILKLIQPLFLDELNAEFKRLCGRRDSGRRASLERFHEKLASLRFFDPACGCGNFLIITYRELRELELRLLKEIFADELKIGQKNIDVATLSQIDVDQFYGIELSEFPARIAEVAMWMMDHIMNNRLSLAFGDSYVRIPLKTAAHIHNCDALEVDWKSVLDPNKCSYVLGNPPFCGAKFQTAQQREQVRRIARLGGSGGTLDFVTAWFMTAGEYVRGGNAEIAFVATNSITQGEQVAQLWPLLFDRFELEISFAHRTFAWGSDARGVAHVHVVIIGLTLRSAEPRDKRLFTYADINGDPVESQLPAISPYLFDASRLMNRHLVIEETSRAINGAPKMIIGSKPIDGGYLIFDNEEKAEFLTLEPKAEKFMHPFIGGVEYIQGRGRWILALQEATPTELRAMPAVLDRLDAVREYRLGERPARRKPDSEPKAPGISARSLAETPAQFHVTVIPNAPFLAIPENSSEAREYLPIGWLEPPVIPSNKLRFVQIANLWIFGILTSRMHMAWIRYIGGRIKSDFQYSIGIVYNNFPWPEASESSREKVKTLGKRVLDARQMFPGATLADLYDNNSMPTTLRKAHRALDTAVDKLYRSSAFNSDRERVEHLFGLYEALITPPIIPDAVIAPRRGRSRRA